MGRTLKVSLVLVNLLLLAGVIVAGGAMLVRCDPTRFFMRRLESTDPKLRVEAVQGLSATQSAEGQLALAQHLLDENGSVRLAARDVLQGYPEETLAAVFSSIKDRLQQMDDVQLLPLLMRVAARTQAGIYRERIEQLAAGDCSALRVLTEQVSGLDAIAMESILAIDSSRCNTCTGFLLRMVQQGDAKLAKRAATTMVHVHGREGLEALLEAFPDEIENKHEALLSAVSDELLLEVRKASPNLRISHRAAVVLQRRGVLSLAALDTGPNRSNSASQPAKSTTSAGAGASMSLLDAQRALKRLGYDVGNPDGKLGERTRRELERFQRYHKLTVTGALDAVTARELKKL